MSLYEELLAYSKPKIDDFFANVTLFENQFSFNDFNKECVKKMFTDVTPDKEIKTVKELKDEIPELAAICKQCAPYYVEPRNQSIKGLDVQMGIFLENLLIDFFQTKLKIKAVHADKKNKQYPDCMILNSDKGILAYFEVKYHGAPFIRANNSINRWCYEGSATLDYKKIVKQLELIESDLDRPTFYLHWIDYPCLKGIFFETSAQVKDYIYNKGVEFDRAEREGDYIIRKKVGYTDKIYSPLHSMGTFEEFIGTIQEMKKNGVTPLEY